MISFSEDCVSRDILCALHDTYSAIVRPCYTSWINKSRIQGLDSLSAVWSPWVSRSCVGQISHYLSTIPLTRKQNNTGLENGVICIKGA